MLLAVVARTYDRARLTQCMAAEFYADCMAYAALGVSHAALDSGR